MRSRFAPRRLWVADEGELSQEELLEHIRQLKVSDLLLSILPTVAQLGYAKLEPDGRDLEQAKLAIEALRALTPVLAGSVPDEVVQRLRAGDREPAARLREGGRRGRLLGAGPDDGRDRKRGREQDRERDPAHRVAARAAALERSRSDRARRGAVDVDRRAVAGRVGGRRGTGRTGACARTSARGRSCSRAVQRTLCVGRTRSGTATVRTRIEIFGGSAAGHEDRAARSGGLRRARPLKLRETSPVRTVPVTRSGAATCTSTGRWAPRISTFSPSAVKLRLIALRMRPSTWPSPTGSTSAVYDLAVTPVTFSITTAVAAPAGST